LNTQFPLLSLLIALPLLGAILIWLRPAKYSAKLALLVTLSTLCFSILLVIGFDPQQVGFQWVEKHNWIDSLNIQYSLGIDGISLLFLPLTCLLFSGIILSAWSTISHLPQLYFSLLLLLLSVTLGIFCALDLILFFFFWELTLIPLYFLISLWGIGANRRYAAVKYTLFMLVGGVPLLFAFLLLAFNHAAITGINIPMGLSFDYLELLNTSVDSQLQIGIFILLLLGFAIKTPIFPLHTWLPTIAMEGSPSIVASLIGIKLGAYGLIRFVIPLAPQAAQELHWLLTGLAVIGLLYGALVALVQTNIRRMLAYASLSHVSLVVLGIASFTMQGIQGALFQLLNFILISGGLFLLSGQLHHRIGSTDVISLGGAAQSMPFFAAFFFLFVLANIGLPTTSGFIGEHLILLGTLQTHTGAGLAALFTVILTASYFLSMYQRTFWGEIKNPVIADACDLRPREYYWLVPFALLILLSGLFPHFILDLTQLSCQNWLDRIIMIPK
jgi:NADH-quinone oxidoreductase subunit M